MEQDETHAALAGLAIDPYHGLIAAPDMGRIDGQVGHGPFLVGAVGPLGPIRESGETLLDGVLMGARERGVHQVPDIGMTGMNG